MNLRFKAFVAFLISLAMPALWLWVVLWVDEGEIPSIVTIILLLQFAAIVVQKRKGKKNRFIANFGIASVVLLFVSFFSEWRGNWILNSSFVLVTLFFYLCYFLDTTNTFFKALTRNRRRHWYQN